MVRFTSRVEYALLAALDLTEHRQGDTPISGKAIAARTGVPAKFLAQILLELKARGLVSSARGPNGGYWLTRPPETISVAQIMLAAGAAGGMREARPASDHARKNAVRGLLEKAEKDALNMLSQKSLCDFLEQTRARQ